MIMMNINTTATNNDNVDLVFIFRLILSICSFACMYIATYVRVYKYEITTFLKIKIQIIFEKFCKNLLIPFK